MGRTIKQIQGDTRTFTITVYDSDGSVYDLTDYTVRFTVKANKSTVDGSASISKTGTVTDAENEVFTVALTNDDTNIDAGIYYYDFQIDNGSSIVKTVESGIFQVVQDVTDTSY